MAFRHLVRDSGGVHGRLDFETDIPQPVMNMVRRAVYRDVKTAAFDFMPNDPSHQDIAITHNTGILHNEIIGQRLALVPLHLTLQELRLFSPDDWKFELDVENETTKPFNVTTRDIRVAYVGNKSEAARGINLSAAAVFPPDPASGGHPIITRLMPRKHGVVQGLALEAKATFGSGTRGTQWCPAAAVVCVPKLDEKKVKEERAKSTDKHAFDTLHKYHIYEKNDFGDPSSTIFSLESCCGLTPEEIVLLALESSANRFRVIANNVRDETHVMDYAMPSENTVGFVLKGQDSGVGGLLQDKALKSTRVAFAGYFTHHTEVDAIIFSFHTVENDPRKILQDLCDEISRDLQDYAESWSKTAMVQSSHNKAGDEA